MRIIKLSGKPTRIGITHGHALKDEIREMQDYFKNYLYSCMGRIFGRLAYSFLPFLAKRMEKFIPEQYRREMKGIAMGAECPYSFILLLNVIDDLLNNLFGCSGFVFNGERLICGRTLDYPIFTDIMPKLNTLFHYQPENGYPFISLAWPGYIGAATAMNSHGLALSAFTSPSKDNQRKATPMNIIYRKAIQYSASLEQLAETITQAPRTIGNNVLLVSGKDSLVVEVSAHLWDRRSWEERRDKKFITVTNHYQTKIMRRLQNPSFPKIMGTAIDPYYCTINYSLYRDRVLRERIEERKNIGVQESAEILRSVSNPGTVQGLVFIPEEKKIWLASGTAPVTRGEFNSLNYKFF